MCPQQASWKVGTPLTAVQQISLGSWLLTPAHSLPPPTLLPPAALAVPSLSSRTPPAAEPAGPHTHRLTTRCLLGSHTRQMEDGTRPSRTEPSVFFCNMYKKFSSMQVPKVLWQQKLT